MRLSARIAELESTGDRIGGVLEMLPGETSCETIARATRQGLTGGFLIVPAPLSQCEWEKLAISQQA